MCSFPVSSQEGGLVLGTICSVVTKINGDQMLDAKI